MNTNKVAATYKKTLSAKVEVKENERAVVQNDEVIIKVDGLWKRYGLPPTPDFKGVMTNIKSGRSLFYADNEVGPWSLRNVSFELKKGEVLGVIGRNGAGKSTLLKVLAGVSPATKGGISIKGRVFPMIELAAGMHADLTGRENVRLLGAVMGIPYYEMEQNVPKVEEFCELGEWFDRPVYTYSSGMAARLGFGVAMHVNADVLLIDEVLSVGDFLFQKKAIKKITTLINSGVTVVLVSHNPYTIERICNRALLLESGNVVTYGSPTEVRELYYNQNVKVENSAKSLVKRKSEVEDRWGTGDAKVTKVEIYDDQSNLTNNVFTGKAAKIRLHFESNEEIASPNISIAILDQMNTVVCLCSNINHGQNKNINLPKGKGYIDCDLPVVNLMTGMFTIQTKISLGVYKIDVLSEAEFFTVTSDAQVFHQTNGAGMFFQQSMWTIKNHA